MPTHSLGCLMGAVLVLVAANLAGAQTTNPAATTDAKPEAGLWQFDVTLSSASRGGQTRSVQACIDAQALATQPEQALISAATQAMSAERGARRNGGQKAPACAYSEFKAGKPASWSATCESPRGDLKGTGSGEFGAQSANFKQQFEMSMMGKRSFTQTVAAKRTGACA